MAGCSSCVWDKAMQDPKVDALRQDEEKECPGWGSESVECRFYQDERTHTYKPKESKYGAIITRKENPMDTKKLAYILAEFGEIIKIQVEVEGMKALNQDRERKGSVQGYNADSFMREGKKIATHIDNIRCRT